jgi:DNA-binding IclR family transcriptional regulator
MARRAMKLEKHETDDEASAGSRSVRRMLDIFELMLARGKPLTVAEIVVQLHIPKSTAYELIRTANEAGYIERRAKDSKLFLGRKLFELGMAYRSQIDLLDEGSRIIEDLREATGETIQLSVMDNELMLVLAKEEGSRPIRIISRIGSRVPVNWAAAGRLLVSDLEDDTLKELLGRTVRPSPTGHAATDVDKLIRQIRRFRRQGFGVEINETNEHAGCVAAPVIDLSGRCVAAISIVAPEQRLARGNRERLIEAVRAAAERLSARLGRR